MLGRMLSDGLTLRLGLILRLGEIDGLIEREGDIDGVTEALRGTLLYAALLTLGEIIGIEGRLNLLWRKEGVYSIFINPSLSNWLKASRVPFVRQLAPLYCSKRPSKYCIRPVLIRPVILFVSVRVRPIV